MVKDIKNHQNPEWMKMNDDEFSIGFEDPNMPVGDYVSENDIVDYTGIQRWEVTAEKNGVIGIIDNMNRRNHRAPLPQAQTNPSVKKNLNSMTDLLRKATTNPVADTPAKANYVLLIKGNMVSSGSEEVVVADMLQAIHNDSSIDDDDIVVLAEIDLSVFMSLPTVKEFLMTVAAKK